MPTFLHVLVMLFACNALLADFVFNSKTDAAVAALDMNAWFSDVEHLARYNRFYQNEDIIKARDWLMQEFTDLGLSTRLEEISIDGVVGHNVVAEITGTVTPDQIYIIGAHYDSISEQPRTRAPGAEDNASGTAALLTLAKVFSKTGPASTIRFVAFSGEERGLFGSIDHVKAIEARNELEKVRHVIIMDMIAFTADDELDTLIETSNHNQELVSLLQASGAHYNGTEPPIETSFDYWGSDHVPFIEAGLSAALIIENDYEDYPGYHRSTDTPDHLSLGMAKTILSMIAGALGYWVLR